MAGKVNDTFSDYHPCQLVKDDGRLWKYLCPPPHHQHLILRIGTEIVPETLVIFNQFTWLLVKEIFIIRVRLTEK
jgi:hypothetical protein